MRVKVEGLRELDRALGELPKATGRNVLTRVGRRRLEPMRAAAEARAPDLTFALKTHVAISTRSGKYARWRYGPRDSFVELFMGVAHDEGGGSLPQAHLQEFGTVHHAAQPYMRPAWDAGKDALLDGIKEDLAEEIGKAAQRLARKTARRGG